MPNAGFAAPYVAPAISAGMGSVISTGMSMLGGLFSKKSKPQYDDKYFQRSVKDAKLAGLHPLFALGGSSGAGSGFIAGQSETGSKLGDALKTAGRGVQDYTRATQTNPLAQELAKLQIQNATINVRKNLIDEQLMASELTRVTQGSYSTGRDKDFVLPPATGTMQDVRRSAGKVEVVPQKTPTTTKSDESVAAGKKPAWEIVDFGGGLRVHMPWSEEGWAEAVSSPATWVPIIMKNTSVSIRQLWHQLKNSGYPVPSWQKILGEVSRLRMDKAYKRITKTEAFKARVKSTISTRKRL